MPETTYHMYVCDGCGHTTIIDKHYRIRVNFCGVCGEKSRLEYQSPCTVKEHPKRFRIFGATKQEE